MRRVLVAGGTGFFGRAALELLAGYGIRGLAASRSGSSDLVMNVEDPMSLREVLQRGDVVIDTAGPFQDRSTTLVEAAIEIGCDLIDISDSLAYAERIDALADRAKVAGVSVLSSCSSVSAIAAWLVRQSGIQQPQRISGFLVPSARYSASKATADSLLRSIGSSVRVWRDGVWTTRRGWLDTRTFPLPLPVDTLHGHLFETADSYWLPRLWPNVQTVDNFVDTRIVGLNTLFTLAARLPPLRNLVQGLRSPGHRLARLLGPRASCLGVEVQDAAGAMRHQILYCPDRGYRLAVLPAVLAARAMIAGHVFPTGTVLPDQQLIDTALH